MADSSIARLLRHYILKLKSFFFSKDVLSFLLFLALSTLFWFVNALDKERETTIHIPVRYTGLPQNIAIINSPPSSIELNVKDQGLRLITSSKYKSNPLTLDLNRTFYEKGEVLFTADQLRGKLSRYLLPTTMILDVRPDSIFVQYEKLSSVSLPIEFRSKIEMAPQHLLTGSVQLEPAYVTVFGQKNVLRKLKSVHTEFVRLKNLSDTTVLNCKLLPVKSVRFASKETKVRLFVEMFTEKKSLLPIAFVNCPENMNIRTFPAVVQTTFNVGMSHFNSVKQDDIQIILDYKDFGTGETSKQKLKIKNNASYISNIRIQPEEVEYILEHK